MEHHRALFEHPPNLVAGDRGVHSAETESRLWKLGVKRVAIPAEGKLSEERQALERTRAFRRGYRWRAGIEGRIASLRRDYGWRKSAYHGQEGMERWLGLGIIGSQSQTYCARVKGVKPNKVKAQAEVGEYLRLHGPNSLLEPFRRGY